jgi:hypothetical protein
VRTFSLARQQSVQACGGLLGAVELEQVGSDEQQGCIQVLGCGKFLAVGFENAEAVFGFPKLGMQPQGSLIEFVRDTTLLSLHFCNIQAGAD